MEAVATVAAALAAAGLGWAALGRPVWLGVEAPVARRLRVWGTVLAGVLTGLAWARGFPLGAVLVWAVVMAAVADWTERVIPNRWVLLVALVGVARWALGISPVAPALEVGLGLGVFFFALYVLMRGGLGLGDVKLAAALGLALGWPRGLDAFVWGVLAAGLYAVLLLARRQARMGDSMAFGPFLALGAVLAVLLA
jgi:leader peptidase (prepilin peptidase)/N-methyltransferase